MPVLITGVERPSPAQRAGVRAGEKLISVNGHAIRDVLDYRFYMLERRLVLLLEGKDGLRREVLVRKGEYDDPGLQFETYLMDEQQRCSNRCVFCFIDQLPRGLRESLYFKDDDSRMSFFFGSYVTLTNLTEEDIARIIRLHISPINISVHTTNPELRVRMLGNRFAGRSLRFLPMLAEAGIAINAQLVLCPGLNDGPELERSLNDLAALSDALESIALVPVGLTNHREGLYPLRLMTREEAARSIEIAECFNARMLAEQGRRIAFPADEMFLIAGLPIPGPEYYGEEFRQLEDGVGLTALLRQEFSEALAEAQPSDRIRTVTVACGVSAAPILRELTEPLREKFPGLTVRIIGVENRLFGSSVTVTGLLCGADLLHALRGEPLGETLILSEVMLRHEGRFLDDMTPAQLEQALGLPIRVSDGSGSDLLEALTNG